MKSKMFWIGGVVVLLLAVGVTMALANGTVTYYACVNNSSGTIHMVDEGETCKNNEMLISWSQRGPDGPPGPAGADGQDGAPGADGQDGAPGADGAPGVDGAPGTDGAPGADGAPGVDGAPGADGAPGVDGADGAPGADGAKGDKGDKGDTGPPGTDTLGSLSCSLNHIAKWNGSAWTCQLDENTQLSESEVDAYVADNPFNPESFQCSNQYRLVTVCPIGNQDGPKCDEVPAGAFCESDGECGLDHSLNNCGVYDWYFNFR